MTRRSEVDWLYRGAGRFYPEAWDRFRDGVPEDERDGDLLAAYARRMENPDHAVREKAWPDARLHIFEESGHAGSEAAQAAARQAVEDFKNR